VNPEFIAVVCGVTGFVLAPAAGAVTALTAPTQSTAETGGAVLAAALCGPAWPYCRSGRTRVR
jgi:hypothetical protein